MEKSKPISEKAAYLFEGENRKRDQSDLLSVVLITFLELFFYQEKDNLRLNIYEMDCA